MATFDSFAELPLEIEGYELQGLEHTIPGFERLSTVIHLWGNGEDGVGEDVTYDALDHVALQDAGATLDLTGYATLGEFCEFIGGVDTFPAEPQRDVSRRYRRWAFESAALDLALRQAGIGIAKALRRKLDPYPTLRFKLDPVNDWTDELIAALVETGAVDSLDLKGFYKGTVVDVETDPELYAKLIEAFPDAWLEDPDVTDETRPLLDPVHERVTWDAPIHSIADIEAMPWSPPRTVNIKPSRFGPISRLFGAYGGGQTELGPGRGQIQYLASIFHPDTANDTAPSGYNDPAQATRPGLPTSPLEPQIDALGFRWTGPQTA